MRITGLECIFLLSGALNILILKNQVQHQEQPTCTLSIKSASTAISCVLLGRQRQGREAKHQTTINDKLLVYLSKLGLGTKLKCLNHLMF